MQFTKGDTFHVQSPSKPDITLTLVVEKRTPCFLTLKGMSRRFTIEKDIHGREYAYSLPRTKNGNLILVYADKKLTTA